MRRESDELTFPAVRAIVYEMLYGAALCAKPQYMRWMEEVKRKLQLRI